MKWIYSITLKNDTMKIGMLLNAPYPSDVRVKKETDALMAAGHTIFLLCLRKKDEKAQEIYNGIHIQRIYTGKNDLHLAFWDIIMSLTFVHPLFKKHLLKWVTGNGIEVLHVHDLPLIGTALTFQKKYGIKVIGDFHENYPDALKNWFDWIKNPIARIKNKLFMNPSTWVKHESTAVLKCDHIIAVVEEMKNRLISDYHPDSSKITVVTNSEDKDFLEQALDENVYKDFGSKFILTYSGNIGPHRGVDTAIRGMQYLKHYKDIVFILVGSSNKAVMNNLLQLVNDLELSCQVFFLGYQHFSKFHSYMHYASVNVIPHKSNGHTDNTVPHKLFQGMMVAKPLLVSSSSPLKRIINSEKSGLVFEANNPTDFADKVLQLYQDDELCRQLGLNGYNATVNGELNWETTQKNLLKVYENIFLDDKPVIKIN